MTIHALALLAALFQQTPAKLDIKDTVEGKGRAAEAKDIVTLEYTGTLLDGKQFDSSKGKPPIAFVLGAGRVIKGWDDGVLGMKVGGKRHLVIPPELAYKDQAVGNGLIPANSTLVFDVELLRIDRTGDTEKVETTTAAPGKGDGAKDGDEVVLNCRGTFLNGTTFVDTYVSKKPVTVVPGKPGVPIGINQMLEGVKPGEKCKSTIPYGLAFGAAGTQGVPPYATLTYEIEVLSVTPGAVAYERDRKKLKIEDTAPGTGAEIKSGDHISVHFTASLSDGKKLGSTKDANQPLNYVVGSGIVTKGFDVALIGMKVGGKRKVTIPPDLAYGDTGAGNGAIPPNSTLIFEIEIVKVGP